MAKEEKKEQAAETKEEAKESKNWSSDIKKLGDKIVSLTLMQAKELGDYLKDEHGIEPASAAQLWLRVPRPAALLRKLRRRRCLT